MNLSDEEEKSLPHEVANQLTGDEEVERFWREKADTIMKNVIAILNLGKEEGKGGQK